MTLLSKQAVDNYNKNNPDDELIFEEVKQQLKDDLDFAVESLEEELIERIAYWREQNRHYTDYLNVDSEIVSAEDFVDAVLERVDVVTKEEI